VSAQVVTPWPEPAHDEGWFASLPKVCLHDHLDGALRPTTVIELAAEIGHELPSHEPAGLEQWFAEAADSGSLARYLETFEHTVAVMQSVSALERVAREYVLDSATDGVIHGEVRWAPEQHLGSDLNLDTAIQAVDRGLRAGEAEAADRGRRISIRQIICALRQNDRSLQVAEAAVRNRDRGVVGFDLAGPEAGFPASEHRAALEHCAQNFLPVTVHAGEADGLASMQQALFDGRALRIGHGVRIAEDLSPREPRGTLGENVSRLPRRRDLSPPPATAVYALGPLASWVRDRRIPLELCPCSNLQTDAAPSLDAIGRNYPAGERPRAKKYSDHPFELLRELGFAVTVNPDNRLMSRTSMTHEFMELAGVFGYDREDFLALTVTAAEATFLSAGDRDDLIERVMAGYSDAPVVGS
jgi:adenosine deaminase